jgi:hypothetical protein
MLEDAYAGNAQFTTTQADFTQASFNVLKKSGKELKEAS